MPYAALIKTIEPLKTKIDKVEKMINPDEEVIIGDICDYAEKMETRKMLEEYMRRLIVEQPKEPVKFLIKEISDNPYPVPKMAVVEGGADAASVETKTEA